MTACSSLLLLLTGSSCEAGAAGSAGRDLTTTMTGMAESEKESMIVTGTAGMIDIEIMGAMQTTGTGTEPGIGTGTDTQTTGTEHLQRSCVQFACSGTWLVAC